MFCKHEWKVLSTEVTESQIEMLNRVIPGTSKAYTSMFERKHIQIVSCDKCGKLKRFVEKI